MTAAMTSASAKMSKYAAAKKIGFVMSSRSDVFALMQRYKKGFDEFDDSIIQDCFVWPCTFLVNGSAVTLSETPVTTAQLKTLKNWHRSVNWEIDVIASSSSKAHVALRNVERLRPDGSLIECASGFYVLTHTEQGWKICALSAIDFPAN